LKLEAPPSDRFLKPSMMPVQFLAHPPLTLLARLGVVEVFKGENKWHRQKKP